MLADNKPSVNLSRFYEISIYKFIQSTNIYSAIPSMKNVNSSVMKLIVFF